MNTNETGIQSYVCSVQAFIFKKESTTLCLLHSCDIHLEKSQVKVHPLNAVEAVAANKRR